MSGRIIKPGAWGPKADVSLAVDAWIKKYIAIGYPTHFLFPFWADNDTRLYQTDDLTPHLYSDKCGYPPQSLSLPVIADGRLKLDRSNAFYIGTVTSIFLSNIVLSETITAGDVFLSRSYYYSSTSYSRTYLYYDSPTQIKIVSQYYSTKDTELTEYMAVGPRPWDLFFNSTTYYDYIAIKASDGITYTYSSSQKNYGGWSNYSLYTCASSDLIIAGRDLYYTYGLRLLPHLYESIAPPQIPTRGYVDKADIKGAVDITATATIDATCGFILGGETNIQATAILSPDGLRHKMGVTDIACDAVISTFPKKIMGGSAAITATGTVIAAVVLKASVTFTGSAVIEAIVANAVAVANIPCAAVVSPPSATRIKFANSSGCTSTGVLSISSNPLVTQYVYPDIVCTGIFYPVPKVKRDGDSFYTQDAFCSIQGSLVFNLSKEWFLTKPTEIPATCVLGTTPSKVNAAISNIAVDASIDIGSPIIAVKVSDIACSASIVCESSFIYSVEIDLRGDSTGYIVGKINRGARAEVVCSNSISTSMRMIKGAIVNARGDSLFTVADPDRAGMVMADIRCPCTVAAAMIMAEQAEIAFACDLTISFEDEDIRLAYQAGTNITAEAILFPDGKPWTMLAVDFFANAVMAGFGKIAPRGDSDIQCSARVSAMGMLLTLADVGIIGDCTVYAKGILAYQGEADIIGDCTVYAEGWIPVSDKATSIRRYSVPSSSREYVVPYENRQIKVLQ